jgi:hypothetical protein
MKDHVFLAVEKWMLDLGMVIYPQEAEAGGLRV